MDSGEMQRGGKGLRGEREHHGCSAGTSQFGNSKLGGLGRIVSLMTYQRSRHGLVYIQCHGTSTARPLINWGFIPNGGDEMCFLPGAEGTSQRSHRASWQHVFLSAHTAAVLLVLICPHTEDLRCHLEIRRQRHSYSSPSHSPHHHARHPKQTTKEGRLPSLHCTLQKLNKSRY